MKKNLLLLTLFYVATSFSIKSMAQSCSSTKTLIVTGASPCSFLITGTLVNAVFFVKDNTGTVIATGSTNTSGTGFVNYDCSLVPDSVTVIDYVNHDTCFLAVSQSTTLAVKLSNFTSAVVSKNDVRLNWTSSFEVNSKDYVVQKSTDATNFSPIGVVAAGSTTFKPVNYSFDDNNYSGGAFYRLKMEDVNGAVAYSKVISEGNLSGTNTVFSVYPNPFRTTVQLTGVAPLDATSTSIQLYSATGKKINYKISGTNSISIDASAPAGIYILKVNGKTTKLIKY